MYFVNKNFPLKIIFPRDFQFLYFLMILHSFIRLIFFFNINFIFDFKT